MGLLEDGQQILQENWSLGDGYTQKSVTYRQKANVGYDASDGTITDGGDQDFPGLLVMIASYSATANQSGNMEVTDEVVLKIDRKIVFPALDLPVDPKVNDQIIHGSILYRVIGTQSDPGPTVRILHCRPIG